MKTQKEQLVQEQAKGGKTWTPEKQSKLDSVVLAIVDLEEAIEKAKAGEGTEKEETYVPAPGTESFYHVRMTKGLLKYDPVTGERYNMPFVQIMTSGEFKNFSQFGPKVGYYDIKVLWDPTKNKK